MNNILITFSLGSLLLLHKYTVTRSGQIYS